MKEENDLKRNGENTNTTVWDLAENAVKAVLF